jgi:hypothetical protein
MHADQAGVTKERVHRSSATEGAGTSPQTPGGTFPAGTALLALGVWFVLTRVVVRYTAMHPGVARLSMIAGVMGAVLAAVALLVALVQSARARGTAATLLAGVRGAFAAPVVALVAAAMFGEPPLSLQWLALGGAAATVFSSLALGIARARGMWLARGALGLLLVGELIELGAPPVFVVSAPGSFWPVLFARLGAVSELAALLGAPLALAWAFASTQRTAGPMRTRLFLPMPAFLGLLLVSMVAMVPSRVAVAVARSAFGVRFDLLAAQTAAVPTGVLLLYVLVPVLLLGAAAVSMGAVLLDRGAAARRALGWLAVLIAGFGAVRLAGPMDPIRLVLVSLAVVLLERAVSLEIQDREAP